MEAVEPVTEAPNEVEAVEPVTEAPNEVEAVEPVTEAPDEVEPEVELVAPDVVDVDEGVALEATTPP